MSYQARSTTARDPRGTELKRNSSGISETEPNLMNEKQKSKLGTLPPVDTMSFEMALKELEGIVSRLEQGEVDLEDSIALYERGQSLKAHCEKKLKAAEGRLEKIVQGSGGKPALGETVEGL